MDEAYIKDELASLYAAIHLRENLTLRRGAAANRLQRYLAHAASTVDAYRELSADALLSIESFPPLERREVVKRHVAFTSRACVLHELFSQTTSGTSGIPLTVLRDAVDMYAMWFDVFALLQQTIEPLRGQSAPGRCFALTVNDNPEREPTLAINPSVNLATVRRIILGRNADFDSSQSDFALIERPRLLCGRPRSLIALADLISRRGESLRPLAVFSSGDNLYAAERQRIERAFGARVYNGYASQEMGLMALECDSCGHMHVLSQRCVIEVLEPGAADPTRQGEGELVVTCTDNWAMPLVRYRSGDYGHLTLDRQDCGFNGSTLTRLDGRISVYFTVGGRKLNPSILNTGFEALPIEQFQVAQDEQGELSVRWVAQSGADEVPVQRLISRLVHEQLGQAPTSVLRVEAIGGPGQKVQRYVQLSRA
jgi:phenylacetate-CoA ligase